MGKEQLLDMFDECYRQIVDSRDEKQMERLGAMVKRVMKWLVNNEPEIAAQAIEMIDGEKDATADNMLTEQEARRIVSEMMPKPEWDMDTIAQTMKQMKLRLDEQPYFNRWALLATMMMIQSDSGNTLSKFMGTSKSSEKMVSVVYQLAKDKLKDEDKKFNIRKYFGLEGKPGAQI